ncbi:hypothetical protein LIF_A2204 [Leptospira interrogans serovar Lai str. IPAV]|uniref:Uncharacterized protein n=1 Tax=Leptospira interrogans serogroup Icterohaemorrhagiae serovar Lai (strain 56601) TaxID=189518 RepID=Q8F2S5_LEPIN|nr:hypothetical protein LA_2693 [Leptospira interrogans serovar Lai str. 56601]AER02993.1 hypothetical protein LIF_A2204 [Leptospira interrogans serovar Lai str. IPAV]
MSANGSETPEFSRARDRPAFKLSKTLSIITNPTNNWISRSIVGITTKSSVKLSSHPTTRPIGKRCVEFSNATCRATLRERCIEFEESVVLSFSYFWVGEVFFIRKTYFLQVKRLILVGTLEKCAFWSLLILKSY